MKSSATWAEVLFASVFLFWAPTTVAAVDKDKAVYIGGTHPDFPKGARTGAGFRVGRLNAEGRITTQSESEFVFDTGTKGAITLRYDAIVSLAFGRTDPFGHYDDSERRGTRQIPRDFFSKDHYLLTVVYRDQSDTEHVVVLWLGSDIVRPVLAALEGRSGKPIRFADAQGCTQYKTPDECGYAGPGALKGVKRFFVDTSGNIQGREDIVSEIQKARLDIQVSDTAADADVILDFRAARGFSGNVGLGEIYVRKDRPRLVSEFAESGGSQGALAREFARTFVAAYKKDNLSQ
jgi:hypothetical protein